MDTPFIHVSHHSTRTASYHSYSSTASPIDIRMDSCPPPPLSPPRHIPDLGVGLDPGWQWGNDPNAADFGRAASVKQGSSLLGGFTKALRHGRDAEELTYIGREDARRGSSFSTVTALTHEQEMAEDNPNHSSEEDCPSSRPSSTYRLQSERQLEQRSLEDSSQAYDKQLLSRIGGPNTPKRSSASYSAQDLAQLTHAEAERRNGHLRPLSRPQRRNTSEYPGSSRWPPSMPSSGAGIFEHGPDVIRAQTSNGSLTCDDSTSHKGIYDHSIFVNEDFQMEDGPMRGLHIHDRSPSGSEDFSLVGKAGTKRRASSPPREASREERASVSSAASQHDLYYRRSIQQLPNRGSPVSRFLPGSVSSTTSSLGPRNGSLNSSLGFSVASLGSSATTYSSSGCLSPGALSPGAIEPDLHNGTPYMISKPLNPSPVASNTHQQRTFSESTQGGSHRMSVDTVQQSRQNSMSNMQGIYMCECCPKKPKKFDAEEVLKLHESEKQYTCAYCPNRFKNKNEAERHQNSLHLRRHSWSCAALADVEAAYHASSSANGVDVCGYCGGEFGNPPQWDQRADHLNHVHNFGECNQAKKFFRADHFRQHLKHSHAGTSGKWTNMLETACMKDEPTPEKRLSPGAMTSRVPSPTNSMVSSFAPSQSNSGTIAETPHDT